jgi:hypothetical protein
MRRRQIVDAAEVGHRSLPPERGGGDVALGLGSLS